SRGLQRPPSCRALRSPDEERLRELPAHAPVALDTRRNEVRRVVGPAGGARDDVVDVLKRAVAVDAAMALAEGRPVGCGGLAEDSGGRAGGLAGADRRVLSVGSLLPAQTLQTERLIAVGLREVGDHLVAAGLAAGALPAFLDGRPTRKHL